MLFTTNPWREDPKLPPKTLKAQLVSPFGKVFLAYSKIQQRLGTHLEDELIVTHLVDSFRKFYIVFILLKDSSWEFTPPPVVFFFLA